MNEIMFELDFFVNYNTILFYRTIIPITAIAPDHCTALVSSNVLRITYTLVT